MPSKVKLRSEARAELKTQGRGKLSDLIGDGAFVHPDCWEFVEDLGNHGVEPGPFHSNSLIQGNKNKQKRSRVEGEW